MFEQDYIMRQVQQMVEALNVVLRLKKEECYKEALDKANQNYQQFFDHSRKEMQNKDEEALIELCTRKNHFSTEMAITLADMLREEGSILEQQNVYEQAKHGYVKALYLYQKCFHTKGAVLPIDIIETLQKLEEKIASGCQN